MPGRLHIWLSDAAAADLEALMLRWQLESRSATIAESMRRAVADYATDRTEKEQRA